MIILGSGPNRIGQGIEFDYCCVHASFALRDGGVRDGDGQLQPRDGLDRLRHLRPPLLRAAHRRGPGQRDRGRTGRLGRRRTPGRGDRQPRRARPRSSWPPPSPRSWCSGRSPASIDLAEDRERWNELCARLGILQPPGGTALSPEEALAVAGSVGYPVLVRPSLRARRTGDGDRLRRRAARSRSSPRCPRPDGALGREGGVTAERPVLVDRFLEDAIEVDVDAVRDATGEVVIGGVMEHVEEAGVHSGDSACALPPPTLAGRRGGRDRADHPADRRGAPGARSLQRAVRGQRRARLRARGESSGEPDGALRGEGHRCAARHGGRPGDGRCDARRIARRGSCSPSR